AATKSKWRQEDGKAIQGPMQGEYLDDIPSQQMTLGSWIQLHPNTLILQRDSEYDAKYETMKGFAGGWTKTTALKTDTVSWQPKSWIVGVLADDKAKAYDWRALRRVRVVNDTVGNTSDVVLVEPDMKSFHVYDRKVGGKILTFQPSNGVEFLYDKQTHSIWNYYGECTEGPLKGKRLTPLRAYQEFLESWCTFHPNTTRMTIAG
ncbi:MAG TPA: DUF3179 domain-containing (seleno)protein, partial [Candidatus Kapabacteria bacterium]|nr:DUF3179 domain-containing (seleno)protein [Candidatus Kapabacteria bacterium]